MDTPQIILYTTFMVRLIFFGYGKKGIGSKNPRGKNKANSKKEKGKKSKTTNTHEG